MSEELNKIRSLLLRNQDFIKFDYPLVNPLNLVVEEPDSVFKDNGTIKF
jgi:hypothetical protein